MIDPTNGAKLPPKPILIELGTKPFQNTVLFHVSNKMASVSSAAASNAFGESGVRPD